MRIVGSGNTPLHVAAINDQVECARVLLVRGGADTSVVNNSHQNAYQVAVISGNMGLAEMIGAHKPEHVVPYRDRPRFNPARRPLDGGPGGGPGASTLTRRGSGTNGSDYHHRSGGSPAHLLNHSRGVFSDDEGGGGNREDEENEEYEAEDGEEEFRSSEEEYGEEGEENDDQEEEEEVTDENSTASRNGAQSLAPGVTVQVRGGERILIFGRKTVKTVVVCLEGSPVVAKATSNGLPGFQPI